MRFIFGIDVSSKTSNVAVLVGNQVNHEYQITNDLPGFKLLLHDLKTVVQPEIVFEATGVYSRQLETFLQDYGYQYIRLNPLTAKKQISSLSLRHRKNDRLDARNLALVQYQNKHKLNYEQNSVYTELKDCDRFNQDISSDIVQAKNRLHRCLQLAFPQIETLLSTTNGEMYWHLVNQFPIACLVTTKTLAELTKFVYHSTSKNISITRADKIASKLLKLAQSSYSAVTSSSIIVIQIKYLTQQLLALKTEKEQIIAKMSALAQDLPEYDNINSIPGVGEISTDEIIAELGDLRRFKNANQINAYVGIDLGQYESGEYKAARHISKQGNSYARKILYKTVINMVSVANYPSCQNHIAKYYQQKKQSSPAHMTKKIAIAAMARLIRTIYRLVSKDQQYIYYTASKRQTD